MPPVMATETGGVTAARRSFFGRSRLVQRVGLGRSRLVQRDGLGRSLALGLRLDLRLGLALDGLDLFRSRNRLRRRLRTGGLAHRALERPLAREDLVGEAELGRRRRALALDALQRQRQAAALGVDLDDLRLHLVALRDDLARVLDVVLRELGDVNEPLDSGHDLDEGAEGDDLRDLALDDVALVVLVEDLLPGIALGLLEPERDPLPLPVDVENLHLDGLADLEHLARMVHVRPGELGDVDQAVHAVEVDEGAEVDDVRNLALDDVSGLEAVEDLLALLLALVLEDGAARQHDVVPRAVELDHLRAQLLAEELVQVLHPADVDQRRRQEAADAQVEDQAALHDLDHASEDGLAGLGLLLDRLPGELEARALLGEDQPALRVFLRQDERVDLLTELDLVLRVDGAADRELGERDDALGLVADVHEHLVLVHAHHGAVDDLPLVDGREGGLVVRDQLSLRPGGPDLGVVYVLLVGDIAHHERRSISADFPLVDAAQEVANMA